METESFLSQSVYTAVGLQKILSLLESEDAKSNSCKKSKSNQELIMGEGGISLLSMTTADAEDPQTLRMVAGAIANLCGNVAFPNMQMVFATGFTPSALPIGHRCRRRWSPPFPAASATASMELRRYRRLHHAVAQPSRHAAQLRCRAATTLSASAAALRDRRLCTAGPRAAPEATPVNGPSPNLGHRPA
ncbi:hypothetical protein Syun_018890 [Stephania yunnanensis]|uniref:Uncharacterized protein n=1 Tax=Stephania yunnanensis TaxID=152371 RepID=A0AAP0IT35_9MAGN